VAQDVGPEFKPQDHKKKEPLFYLIEVPKHKSKDAVILLQYIVLFYY
jgi:hypothetical protein